MAKISASEVRSNFSDILSRVAYGKERVTVMRRGRPVASLLPIEDLVQNRGWRNIERGCRQNSRIRVPANPAPRRPRRI